MFDERTRTLISHVPPVADIDNAQLDQLLTDAYVAIASMRLRTADGQLDVGVQETEAQLRQLAIQLSIFATVSEDGESRTAAAFVGATAFQLLALLPAPGGAEHISISHVPDWVSAALLFLLAGYPADAAEMAAGRVPETVETTGQLLERSIAFLALGGLTAIGGNDPPHPPNADLASRADSALLSKLCRACLLIADAGLGRGGVDQIEAAETLASEVQEKALFSFPIASETPIRAMSAFPAAHHIATLLAGCIPPIRDSLLSLSPDPMGPDQEAWAKFRQERARRKPYLWRNHVAAIAEGLLNRGTSAVVTFPTGAGKSTLAELKVATTAIGGGKVVYLVPTLALVSQVERSLRDLLLETEVAIESDYYEDQLSSEFAIHLTAEVTVMTTERCLLWLSLNPEFFQDVGLVVFDECHLMHLDASATGGRSLDAMLCLLTLLQLSPHADVLLLSAMVANGGELAAWLATKYEKSVVVCDDAWKPTRQARGSILFEKPQLDPLRRLVQDAVTAGSRIPQSRLRARPKALFALTQTWQLPSESFKLVDLTQAELGLKGSVRQNRPQLDLNSSEAARELAHQFAEHGSKVLVFFHDTRQVLTALRYSVSRDDRAIPYTAEEEALVAAVEIELGGREYVVEPRGIAGAHFGLLLPYERDLVESCFRRQDGISLLCATSTLAQGINLPADIVLIAGTSRGTAGGMQAVHAHELLNAAGRAGRAGLAAYGLVLVVPTYLVQLDRNRLGRAANDLINDVLSQEDRCLSVADPIQVLLDRVALAPGVDDGEFDMMLLRLPEAANEEGASVKATFDRSLAAFKAEHEQRIAQFDQAVALAVQKRSMLLDDDDDPSLVKVAKATGLRPLQIKRLTELLGELAQLDRISCLTWYDFICRWLEEMPELVARLRLQSVAASAQERSALEAWQRGSPYVAIQQLLKQGQADQMLKEARHFGRHTVREISFLIGLVGQLVLSSDIERKEQLSESAIEAAALIRDGMDTREKLVLFQMMRSRLWTRVRVHQEAPRWLQFVRTAEGRESAADTRQRVRHGIAEYERRQPPA